ncbi:HAD family hydrolase [Ottowia testudinis]|uniref:HAD-IA family hydrolase n=1 Tax=Ottowia testudinis TaxID=2816950 RepID=A0A975H3X1_9BURK|nr:HAD-IA family hydrolase [Ottowia testudinis]QTD46249.1 HAD-IA family hydrolase [Ottowia testudinis]
MTALGLDVARIRAITLDLDDTLWPIWPTLQRAEDALGAWLTTHAPRAAGLARNPEARHRARQQALTDHAAHAHDLATIRREAIRQLLAWAGDDPALAEPAFEVFFDERQRVTLFGDALPALAALSARYPLVALSNGNADVHRVGIGRYFHAAVSATQIGVGKPERRIFAAAAQAAGVPEHAVLHVGDDALLDGAGALAAGMQLAWVNRASAHWPPAIAGRPHAVVPDMRALCGLLGVAVS